MQVYDDSAAAAAAIRYETGPIQPLSPMFETYPQKRPWYCSKEQQTSLSMNNNATLTKENPNSGKLNLNEYMNLARKCTVIVILYK